MAEQADRTEAWFWGFHEVRTSRGQFIIRAGDKECALGRLLMFCLDNPQFGFKCSDDPTEAFEPYIEPMTDEEARHYDIVRADQDKKVIPFLIHEACVAEFSAETAITYVPYTE